MDPPFLPSAKSTSLPHDIRRARFLVALISLAMLGLCVILPTRSRIDAVSESDPVVLKGIDPNSSDWFELAQLPGIGETLSRRIIAFRESQSSPVGGPVFHDASDLDRVSGIGAGIIRRIAPFVRFPSPEIASAVDKHMTGG